MLHARAMLITYLRDHLSPPIVDPDRWVDLLLVACQAVAHGEPECPVTLPEGVQVNDQPVQELPAWLLVGIFGLNETMLVEPGVLSGLEDDL